MTKLGEAIKNAKRVYLAGNGGSAANAIHIANDLISCGVRAYALTADVATLTAIANDYDYSVVFSRQLRVFGEKGDLLIVLSGSGKSSNIVAALNAAKEIGMESWAIVGMSGGPARDLADNNIYYAGSTMQEAEQEQLRIGHSLLAELKEKK